MTRKLLLTLLALALSLAAGATAALAATARPTADPGVTPTSVLVGGTAPLTGPQMVFASISRGAKAYFDYVNSRGGVNGRRIDYVARDDASDPVRTVAETRRLVEQDGVFAVFNSFGTEQNLAVRDYLNQRKVPQLFAASGATTLARTPPDSRSPSGCARRTRRRAGSSGSTSRGRRAPRKSACSTRTTASGRSSSGLRRGIQRSRVKLASVQPYDAASFDVEAQVARLRVSGATVFAVFASPKHAAEALKYANRLGWRPKLTVGNASASSAAVVGAAAEKGANQVVKGMVSVAYVKDPTDPRWLKDSAMKLFQKIVARFAPGSDASDVYLVYGMAAAWTAVEAIRRAGTDLTRQRLVDVVGSLNLKANPFLVPGIVLRTGPNDHFPIDQMVLQRWQKGAWRSFGGLWTYRGG